MTLKQTLKFNSTYGRLRNPQVEQIINKVLEDIQANSRITDVQITARNPGNMGLIQKYRIQIDATKEEVLVWEWE